MTMEWSSRRTLRRRDVADWDSVAHVKLILSLEEEFGIRFSEDEVSSIQTVGNCSTPSRHTDPQPMKQQAAENELVDRLLADAPAAELAAAAKPSCGSSKRCRSAWVKRSPGSLFPDSATRRPWPTRCGC